MAAYPFDENMEIFCRVPDKGRSGIWQCEASLVVVNSGPILASFVGQGKSRTAAENEARRQAKEVGYTQEMQERSRTAKIAWDAKRTQVK